MTRNEVLAALPAGVVLAVELELIWYQSHKSERGAKKRTLLAVCALEGMQQKYLKYIFEGIANDGECGRAWREFIGRPAPSETREGRTSTRSTRVRVENSTVDYNSRTFGIEFEGGFSKKKYGFKEITFNMSYEERDNVKRHNDECARKARVELIRVAKLFGIEVQEYTSCPDHRDLRGAWKMMRDGSLGEDNKLFAMTEVVSPILVGRVGWEQLEKMCQVFALVGFGVNNTCGTHIHLGVKDLSFEAYRNVVLSYNRSAEVWEKVLAKYRTQQYIRANGCQNWAKYYTSDQVERLMSYNDFADIFADDLRAICYDVNHTGHYPESRYYAVNMVAYHQRKTIEFRAHQATTEFRKISSWIHAQMELVAWCNNNCVTDWVTRLEDMAWLSDDTRSNFAMRIALNEYKA